MPDPQEAAKTPNDAAATQEAGTVKTDASILDGDKEGSKAEGGILDQAGEEARQEQLAEEKRLREAKDEDLSAEDKAKKEALLKADKEKQDKAEEEARAKAVPEKYEFKVPEGMTLDQALVDEVTPLFKDLKLSQEQAQKLVDVYAKQVKTQADLQQANFDKFREESYKETIEALGPDKKASMAYIAKARDALFSEESLGLLKAAGIDNCKAFILDLIKYGKTISEDKLVTGKPAVTVEDKSAAEVLFPKNPSEKHKK